MDRETIETVELIDLGAASVETRGDEVGSIDTSGFQLAAGLSDD